MIDHQDNSEDKKWSQHISDSAKDDKKAPLDNSLKYCSIFDKNDGIFYEDEELIKSWINSKTPDFALNTISDWLITKRYKLIDATDLTFEISDIISLNPKEETFSRFIAPLVSRLDFIQDNHLPIGANKSDISQALLFVQCINEHHNEFDVNPAKIERIKLTYKRIIKIAKHTFQFPIEDFNENKEIVDEYEVYFQQDKDSLVYELLIYFRLFQALMDRHSIKIFRKTNESKKGNAPKPNKGVEYLKGNTTNLDDLRKFLRDNKFICEKTIYKDFVQAFSGKEVINKIIWIGTVPELSYFIKELNNLGLIAYDSGVWVSTKSTFKKPDGTDFTESLTSKTKKLENNKGAKSKVKIDLLNEAVSILQKS